jgi:ribose 5-phosphate isomerase RpiB
MNKIVTVSDNKQGDFTDRVNEYLEEGYKLSSSNCGFLNSESYDFVDYWQAILYMED